MTHGRTGIVAVAGEALVDLVPAPVQGYFEMAPGGYSTLERHEHVHAVLILRGRGHCLVGSEVRAVAPNDLVYIPSMTWHQFRATQGEPLGFLCMVNAERDKPQLPTPTELAVLKQDPAVARFLAE